VTFTDDELISLIEEVTTTLGQIFLSHRELTEGLLDDGPTERSQKKINDLKKRLDVEKDRLTQHRRSRERKRELERIRKSHERGTTTEGKSPPKLISVRDQRGQVVGWLQSAGRNRVTVLDRCGHVVGRVINGQTYDGHGRLAGDGDQGLRVLGQTLKKVAAG